MYIDGSARKVMTYQRPQAPKVTASLPNSHHVLEDVLSKPSVRKAMLWMTRRGEDGKAMFEKLCEYYDNPRIDTWTRLRWALPHRLIDLGMKKAGLDKEVMKKNLFHHPPTVKSLTLTAKSIGTYGLTIPQRFTAPLFTVWNITQACNLTCKHCYQDAKHKPLADELTTDEKLDLLDQMADEFVPFVAFAGGEPLIASDLWEVLAHCQKRGFHVTVATNGMFLTPEMCHRLKEAGVKYIEVSIDSLNPREHDEFRGLQGAWARSIQGIRNSVAAGIRTGMATCFTRETVHTVDDVVKFAIDLGCKTFAHFNFIPVGRGKEIMHHDLTPGQRELLMRKLQRHLAEGKISVISTAPQFGRSCIVYGSDEGVFATGHAGKGEGKKTMILSRYIGGCGAGRCYCSIQPNGIINACVYIPSEEVGDIRRQSFKDIWDNALFDTLSDRDDRGDHCGVCDYKHYCGGCRARSVSYTGDIQAGDPGCVYNFREWNELTASIRHSAPEVYSHAGDGCCGGGCGTVDSRETRQLVQIMAVGAVAAAARSGRVAEMDDDDVRDVDDVADRLKSILAGSPN
ncbi:MAG TPA: radical SAM protein [Terriglobia bacterium]|nr:radical SAM protein [Terriglobia bacterium]